MCDQKHMLRISHTIFVSVFIQCREKQQNSRCHNYRGLMVRIVKKVVILYAKTLLNSWRAVKALIATNKSQPLLTLSLTTTRVFTSFIRRRREMKINLLKIIEGENYSWQTVNRYMFFNYFAFSTLSKCRKQRKMENENWITFSCFLSRFNLLLSWRCGKTFFLFLSLPHPSNFSLFFDKVEFFSQH